MDDEAAPVNPHMNERQQAHIDHYLRRLTYWQERKPSCTTARLLAARDADEAHPLRSEEEARRRLSTCGGWSMSKWAEGGVRQRRVKTQACFSDSR